MHSQSFSTVRFLFFFSLPLLTNTMENNQHDGELIGLFNHANGRNCHQHGCCGHHVRIGNLIRFKCEVMRVEYAVAGDPEPDFCYEMVLKMVVIRDGTKSCHVAFLPRHAVAQAQEVICLHGKFAQVLELYDDDGAGPTQNAKS
jgi:hypothetical protein